MEDVRTFLAGYGIQNNAIDSQTDNAYTKQGSLLPEEQENIDALVLLRLNNIGAASIRSKQANKNLFTAARSMKDPQSPGGLLLKYMGQYMAQPPFLTGVASGFVGAMGANRVLQAQRARNQGYNY